MTACAQLGQWGRQRGAFCPWLDLSQRMGTDLKGALARPWPRPVAQRGGRLSDHLSPRQQRDQSAGPPGPSQPPEPACLPGTLTLIIWERSPASASSSTMFSSLSSINESKYLMMLGWFSCCPTREREGGRSSEGQLSPAPAACRPPAGPRWQSPGFAALGSVTWESGRSGPHRESPSISPSLSVLICTMSVMRYRATVRTRWAKTSEMSNVLTGLS